MLHSAQEDTQAHDKWTKWHSFTYKCQGDERVFGTCVGSAPVQNQQHNSQASLKLFTAQSWFLTHYFRKDLQVLVTLTWLNKPRLFEESIFEQTTKRCTLRYLQRWHLLSAARLQVHYQFTERHLGGSEMQTGPWMSLCVKASKWAGVVFFSVCELSYVISAQGLWGWVNKCSHASQRPVCFY